MKKILYPLFTAILIAMLVFSPVGAGGVSIRPRLGSLIVDITAWGLPNNTDYTFTITASGIASVACTNGGGNQAPGRNYPHVDGTASTGIPWQDITKGGKVTTSLEAIPPQEDPNYFISGKDGGCPNSNWSAKVDFVYWQSLKFDITAIATGKTETYLYTCVTTRTGPNSTPSTFDDGTVSCK
jgi:hypothetical protein